METMRDLDEAIACQLGSPLVSSGTVGGGCIHEARSLVLKDGRRVFVKSASGATAKLLAAEREGLERLAPHMRVPMVLAHGNVGGESWLAMEWLDLRPLGGGGWRDLGKNLAALHTITADEHGWDHDNFIGSTPQINRRMSSWLEFYQNCRLLPQLELAGAKGHDLPVSKILAAAAERLAGHEPRPSLLHGDLWTGNTASLRDETAVVFDPAPYFGDPETDLAMLELFGDGLTAEFLGGYGCVAKDRKRRRPLYDLYHALNHLNLFGSGYTGMVRQCLGGIGAL